jgi:hypothetical protein
VRVLWWSGLTVLTLGLLRTLALLAHGIAHGDTATIVVNAVLVPVAVALLFVLWRVRDNLRS